MKNPSYPILSALLFALLLVGACKKNNPDPDLRLQKEIIAEAILQNNTKLTLYADQRTLSVGYMPIFITLEDSSGKLGSPQTQISLTPIMDMHSMQHSSPVVQPVFNSELGYYQGAVVFTMPSSEMGSWKLITEIAGETVDFDLNILPPTPNTKPVGSYLGTNGKRYVISLVAPKKPRIGMNDLQILVNEQVNMHDFPAIDRLNLVMVPEMPSMGHGSPNNENPIGLGNGLYSGKVNFTMSGDWRLHFTLKEGDEIIVEDGFLDLIF